MSLILFIAEILLSNFSEEAFENVGFLNQIKKCTFVAETERLFYSRLESQNDDLFLSWTQHQVLSYESIWLHIKKSLKIAKEVIRCCISTDRQYNGQKKNDKQ